MKTKYRVISNGILCYPQYKFLFFWSNFSCGHGDVAYETKEECIKFIKEYELHKNCKRIKVLWESDQASEL